MGQRTGRDDKHILPGSLLYRCKAKNTKQDLELLGVVAEVVKAPGQEQPASYTLEVVPCDPKLEGAPETEEALKAVEGGPGMLTRRAAARLGVPIPDCNKLVAMCGIVPVAVPDEVFRNIQAVLGTVIRVKQEEHPQPDIKQSIKCDVEMVIKSEDPAMKHEGVLQQIKTEPDSTGTASDTDAQANPSAAAAWHTPNRAKQHRITPMQCKRPLKVKPAAAGHLHAAVRAMMGSASGMSSKDQPRNPGRADTTLAAHVPVATSSQAGICEAQPRQDHAPQPQPSQALLHPLPHQHRPNNQQQSQHPSQPHGSTGTQQQSEEQHEQATGMECVWLSDSDENDAGVMEVDDCIWID